jgi:hypothetical protein
MRNAGSRLSAYQLCTLLALIFSIVYYLAKTNSFCNPTLYDVGYALTPEDSRNHVLVTGGAGYIGSHAAKKLLLEGHAVTVLDNLSRGNQGAIDALRRIALPGRFQFIKADLGDLSHIRQILRRRSFDVVMHFAAVAYVGTGLHCAELPANPAFFI